jgi:hypothetical protein
MRVSFPIRAESAGRWRARVSLLMLGLSLTGCGAPPVRQADVPSFGEVKALFVLGQDVQVINIRALDRLPITAAVLVLPTGEQVAAYSIDQQKDPTLSNSLALGGPTGNVTGIGGGVPLLAGPGMSPITTVLTGQVASVALIRVPELAIYRTVWPQSKIKVHMGFAPDDRVEILTAPQPGG